MLRISQFRLLIGAVLGLASATLSPASVAQSNANPSQNSLSWDCWLATSEPVSIRCIAAREGRPTPDPEADARETLLLDHVHTLLHSGRAVEIEGVLVSNLEVFQNGSIWTIRIWSLPHELSWLEDRPATLVRRALCPAGIACNVLIVRP